MAFAVAADTAGNAVFAGRFGDAATLAGATPVSAGDFDAAIAKFDPDGRLVWIRRPGGNGRDSAQGIAIDTAGNAIVTGFFRGTGGFGEKTVDSAGHRDVFVAKYDPAGTLIWLRRAGGALSDEGRGAATDNNGNVFVTGGFEGEAVFAEDLTITTEKGRHAFLAKYDTAGTLLWVRQAGGDGRTWGNAVATDSVGNVLISGAFTRVATFSGTKLKSAGDLDIFIAKYDPGGNLLWAKTVGGRGRETAHSVTTDTANNLLVAGKFSRIADFGGLKLKSVGDKDAFIAKYAPGGDLTWAVSLGGHGDDTAHGLATDGTGNVLATGSFQGRMTLGDSTLTSAGRHDIFVAAFRPDGTLLSAQAAGGPGSDSGFAIASDGHGGAYVAGSLSATAAIGENILHSTGSDDLFIARLGYGKP